MNPLERALRQVRRRVRLERLLRGGALVGAYLLAASLLASYVLARNNFSDDAILWCRVIFGLGLAVVVWRYLLQSVLRPPSLRRVARFLEERYPELEQRLVTAVELAEPSVKVHPDLRRLIQRDAAGKFERLSLPRFYWPDVSAVALSVLLATLVGGLLFYVVGPAEYGYSLNRLLGGWSDAYDAPLYRIEVSPGSATVAQRADLEIRASAIGFEAAAINVFALYPNNTQWESTRMLPDTGAEGYRFLFFDIREPIEYYVEADGIRSETFRIDVSEIPRVRSVQLTLKFPSYTGLSDLVLDDERYIRALRGTRVEIRLQTDQPALGGAVKFESGSELELEGAGETAYTARFEITDDDFFRIHLRNSENVLSPGSDEFVVEALEDQAPIVSFLHPGRDRPVTNIEEVFTEVKVEDDYGIRSLTLHYSVNGGEEEKVPLEFVRGARQTVASHTFYLEELDLMPGDFVSYYAKADDAVSTSATDIFFLEVQPFDREYRQVQAAGGGGGGREMDLSRQQKQIVVATFSLIHEKDRFSREELVENSQTLGLIQQRLQTQVRTIIERIERRQVSGLDSRFNRMRTALHQALEHMKPAEQALNEVDPEGALPEEQRALQQLLRAEALFNEVQVSMSYGSEGSPSSAEELADLIDLELDRTKNQYETLQQNRQLRQDQALDEALEKLKELSRRQEQQLERQRRQAMSGASGGQASQQDMIEELEQLSRELARLSRQEQDQRLSQISRELSRAARDLRRSAGSDQSSQQAMESAQQATERLRQAQEALTQERQSQVRSQFEDLRDQAQALVREQREIVDAIAGMAASDRNWRDSGRLQDETRELFWRKQDMQESVQELEGKLHQAARRMASEEPEAARRLKEAGLSIRDQRLPDKMREGSDLLASGLMGMAESRERGVGEDLQALEEKIREAERALGSGRGGDPRERLRQALGEAGNLVENLESLRERAEARNGAEGDSAAGEGARSDPSDTGQARATGSEADGSDPSSQPGSQTPGGHPGDGATTSGTQGIAPQAGLAGSLSSAGINPNTIRREWSERMQEADRLRELLAGSSPELARDTARLLEAMRRIDLGRVLGNPEEVQRLRADLIDGFHQLQLEISRALKEASEDFLRPVNQDEVPPEFRERVEDYYRRLAARKGQ
jgi:hypothetical protein